MCIFDCEKCIPSRAPKITSEELSGPWRFRAVSSNESKVMALFWSDRHTNAQTPRQERITSLPQQNFFLHLFDGHSKCALPSSFLNLASFFFRILFYYYSDEENPSHPVWLCRQHAPPMWWMSDKRFNGALGLLSFSIPSHWWILLCLTWSPTSGCRIRNPCRWRIGPAPPASS